jgi:pimeloyl-ACP methyl ester carboxylesterase
MSEPIMIKEKGSGIQIQLATWEGDGDHILCIHGLTANCRCWDLMASALASHHSIIAMDLRGRGLSDSPPSGYSLDHHCRDVSALMDNLNLEQVVLMGHSLGAIISLAFAARHPQRVRGLILIDGGGKLNEDQTAKVFAGIKPSLDRLGKIFPTFEAYMSPLKQFPFFQPWSDFLDTYFRYEIEEVEGGVRSRVQPEHIEEEIHNLLGIDITQFYPEITCPTLILRATEGMLGNDDLVLPEDVVEHMTREMSKAKRLDMVNVTGTNHYSIVFGLNDNRDQAILNFLKSS